MQIAALIIIMTTVFFDALRDAWHGKKSWGVWHAVKWAQFYPMLGLCWYLAGLPLWWLVWAVPLAWAIWRLTARYIGGVKWFSFWGSLLKNVWKMIAG